MLVKSIYLSLFLAFFTVSSVYILPPGMPQPGDLWMAALIVVLITGFIIRPPVRTDVVFIGALFVGYVALVNLFWYTQYQTRSFWMSPLYYAYNFGAMLVVASLTKAFRERFVTPCQIAIAVAIVLEIIALFVLPKSAYRSVGTFNNPNQLGYWALILGCCLLVLKRDEKLTLTDFAALCGAGYLTVASLSKAAMVSFALLLVLGVACQRLTRSAKLLFLAVAFAATSVVLIDGSAVSRFFSESVAEQAADRLSDIGGQTDDSLGGRGYDRIWRSPEYLLFGAGEGAAERFVEFGPRREMHSTLGTVLFSYGIIGFCLFLAMLAMVFRRGPRAYILYSLPIWAYGMTHQGLRDTMLWIFLGMAFGMANYVRGANSPGRVPMASQADRSRTVEAQAIEH